jgi:hypothetical protein
MITPLEKHSTVASRSYASASNRYAAIPSLPTITHNSGLPNAPHHPRIVRRSRELGDAVIPGCVCRKPTTSPRFSSRCITHAGSNATLAG